MLWESVASLPSGDGRWILLTEEWKKWEKLLPQLIWKKQTKQKDEAGEEGLYRKNKVGRAAMGRSWFISEWQGVQL